MFKTQVGIGVLQLPFAFSTLGLVPGICCFLLLAIIAYWLGYQIGQAGRHHPNARSLGDIGQMMFGRVGKEIFGTAYFLCESAIEPPPAVPNSELTLPCADFLFVGASAITTISIALNSITKHALCTCWFVLFAALIAWGLSSIRSISNISTFAILGTFSILTSSKFSRNMTEVSSQLIESSQCASSLLLFSKDNVQ